MRWNLKSILKLICSMWVILPLIVFCFDMATNASGMAASAFVYDEVMRSAVGYDAPSPSALEYDSASASFANENGNPAPRNGAFAGFAEFLAADSGANIALGSRYSGLRTFASDIGADHLLDVPNNQWKDVFLSHVDNPSTTFHVNMGGFFGDTPSEMILNEMQSGSHTGWELQQLQQAGRLPQVNFYQPGQLTPIPNPFIK